MSKKRKTSGAYELNKVLSDMNADGQFPISVLTDDQGLTIASAAVDDMDPDPQSAVVAFLSKTIVQASKQLDIGEMKGVLIEDAQGQRLVCRSFQVGSNQLILSVIIPNQINHYRRLMNRTISRASHIWKEYWE